MRFDAIVAAAVVPAVFFGSAHKPSVTANIQQQKPVVITVKADKNPAKKPTSKIVTVKPGDYLAKIARANKTTYPRMFAANPKVKDPNLIYPGQKLRVPDPNEKLIDRDTGHVTKVETNQTSQPQTTYYAPKVTPHYSAPASGSVWDRLAQCESGGNWSINTGNGYYGGLQFTLGTWRGAGGSGYPNQASRAEQIHRAQIVQARSGWGAWPACSAKLGLL